MFLTRMRSHRTPVLRRLRTGACAAALLAAPVFAQSPAVLGVDAAFAGFDDHGRSTYEIGLTLAPHQEGALVATLADLASPPPYDPFPPEATWRYEGNSAVVTRVSHLLSVPLYYRGDVAVRVFTVTDGRIDGTPIARVEPLMRSAFADAAVSYGAVDLDRMRLRLLASPVTNRSNAYEIRVANMNPVTEGVVALSLDAARIDAPFGTILLDPATLTVLTTGVADENGVLRTSLALPAMHVGTTVYLQAMGDSLEDSLTPWLFSNGVRIEIR